MLTHKATDLLQFVVYLSAPLYNVVHDGSHSETNTNTLTTPPFSKLKQINPFSPSPNIIFNPSYFPITFNPL